MSSYLQLLRRFNRDTRLYLITPAMIGIAFYGMFVVLFNLYLLRLGYGPRFLGIINASGQAAFILMSLPAGALGRRWGSRRLVAGGILLYLLGFGLLPLADLVPVAARTPWLVASFMLAFLGGPLYWVNSSVYLMGAAGPAERTHAFSVRTALFPLGGFLGSLLGGVLPGILATVRGVSADAAGPYRDALLLAALFYLPALLAMLAAGDVDPPPESEDSTGTGGWRAAPLSIIAALVLVEMLRMAGEMGTLTFFNVYLDDGLGVPTARIGAIAGVALLVAGGAALSTPFLSARLGRRHVVPVAMLGTALFLLPLALVPTWLAAAAGYTGAMALAAISNTALAVYRMERVGAAWWGLMAGAAVTGQGVGESGILLGGGFLIAGAGFASYYLLLAALTTAGALLFWLLVPDRTDPAAADRPPSGS